MQPLKVLVAVRENLAHKGFVFLALTSMIKGSIEVVYICYLFEYVPNSFHILNFYFLLRPSEAFPPY